MPGYDLIARNPCSNSQARGQDRTCFTEIEREKFAGAAALRLESVSRAM
jgi:hypothetical protein